MVLIIIFTSTVIVRSTFVSGSYLTSSFLHLYFGGVSARTDVMTPPVKGGVSYFAVFGSETCKLCPLTLRAAPQDSFRSFQQAPSRTTDNLCMQRIVGIPGAPRDSQHQQTCEILAVEVKVTESY